MSDNRTTDLLRKLLEERGIEWTAPSMKASVTHFTANGSPCIAYPSNYFDGGMRVEADYLTPEQAIAATLGSEREKRLEKLVQKALDECWCDEWWYEDARKLGMEANY